MSNDVAIPQPIEYFPTPCQKFFDPDKEQEQVTKRIDERIGKTPGRNSEQDERDCIQSNLRRAKLKVKKVEKIVTKEKELEAPKKPDVDILFKVER